MTVKKTQQTLNATLEKTEQSLSGLETALENNVGGRATGVYSAANGKNAGLPEGWYEIKISEVAEVVAGGTPKAGDPSNFAAPGSAIAWLTPADLSKYKSTYISHGKRDLSQSGYDSSSAKLLPKGSLLFSSRAPIGYVAIASNEISTNQGFKNFVFPYGVDSLFAYYYLTSIRSFAESLGTGTTFKEISGSTAKTLPFILPPLAEQTIIAQTLDTLLAQVDNIKTRLDAIPNILKTFRQSVLAAAVSGKLTEAWRGENECGEVADFVKEINEARFKLWRETEVAKYKEKGKEAPKNFEKKYKYPELESNDLTVPNTWSVMSWNQISMWITYGFTKPMPHVDKGPLIVTAKNVRLNEVDLKGAHNTTIEAYNSLRPKDKPFEGDILIVKDGATTGRACLAPSGLGDYCISQSVAVVWLKYSPMIRKYLLWCVQSDNSQRRIQEVMAGMAMPHLSITDFGNMLVPIPPKEEQTEIVRRVEELFTFADQIEQQVQTAQGRVNNLTQSILAKAFRGELTAQWRAENPNLITGDNSAEALLAKIQAERDALKKSSKPKKSTKKKSTTKKADRKKVVAKPK